MSVIEHKDSILVRSLKDIVGGTMGGIGITIVGHPFDTLKVRLQTQSHTNPIYSGMLDCIKKTVAAEGFGGLYKGVASPLVGQMFFNAVQFFAYSRAKDIVSGGASELTIAQYFWAGALTGVQVAFVEAPIDLMKTQLQVQVFQEKPLFTSFLGTVAYICKNHGIRGVYQGLAPTIYRNVPAVGFYFGAYEYVRESLRSPGETVDALPAWKLLTAGAMGGWAYWAFTFPIDVVKSAMQADNPDRTKRRYTGMVDCAKQLYKEGGVPRFFKGIAPCIWRAAPANAVCFF